MSKESPALSYRRRYRGLVGIKSKMPIKDMSVLSRIYTQEWELLAGKSTRVLSSPLTIRAGEIPLPSSQMAVACP